MSSSVSVTDTSENHYDSGSDSDDDEEDQKSTAESRFSYFSIKSSTAADKADKAVKFANTVTCLQVHITLMKRMTIMMMTVQSSLKWRAALLRGRKRRSRPSLTDEDVSFLTTNTLFSEVDIRSACQWGDGVMPKLVSMICLFSVQTSENGGESSSWIVQTEC